MARGSNRLHQSGHADGGAQGALPSGCRPWSVRPAAAKRTAPRLPQCRRSDQRQTIGSLGCIFNGVETDKEMTNHQSTWGYSRGWTCSHCCLSSCSSLSSRTAGTRLCSMQCGSLYDGGIDSIAGPYLVLHINSLRARDHPRHVVHFLEVVWAAAPLACIWTNHRVHRNKKATTMAVATTELEPRFCCTWHRSVMDCILEEMKKGKINGEFGCDSLRVRSGLQQFQEAVFLWPQ